MRIALLFHPWNLSFRGKWTWDNLYDDPRGMSGSELGFVEIGRELVRQGHHVCAFTDSDESWWPSGDAMHILPWCELSGSEEFEFDLAIAINHPDGLQHFDCPKLCIQWVNSFEYCSRAQIDLVDHWVSPSEPHKRLMLRGPHELQDGLVQFSEKQWSVVPLGCNPELYKGIEKVPGRVIYASSPDRGLHHLLQVWPRIKREVPHAHLRIFYRLKPWIDELKAVPEPFPPIEENRQRALFIEDALRRLSDPKWGIEVVGPVSRNRIAREMGEAECLAYPCDTLRWSEGFSCTTLEACAAGAVPVIFDCDALGEIYGGNATVIQRGDLDNYTKWVVKTLNDPEERRITKAQAGFLSQCHTWRHTCETLMSVAHGLTEKEDSSRPSDPSATPVEASST